MNRTTAGDSDPSEKDPCSATLHFSSFPDIYGVGRDQGGTVDFRVLDDLPIKCGLCVGTGPLPSEFQFHVHPARHSCRPLSTYMKILYTQPMSTYVIWVISREDC